MFGPHFDVGPDGMLTGVSDTWGGVGIWHNRDAAEAMVAAPGDHMPWLGETVAAWHCLSVPVSHRGAVIQVNSEFVALRATELYETKN